MPPIRMHQAASCFQVQYKITLWQDGCSMGTPSTYFNAPTIGLAGLAVQVQL